MEVAVSRNRFERNSSIIQPNHTHLPFPVSSRGTTKKSSSIYDKSRNKSVCGSLKMKKKTDKSFDYYAREVCASLFHWHLFCFAIVLTTGIQLTAISFAVVFLFSIYFFLFFVVAILHMNGLFSFNMYFLLFICLACGSVRYFILACFLRVTFIVCFQCVHVCCIL